MKRLPSELNALKLRNRKKQIFTKLTEKIKTKEVYCQNTESSDIEKKLGYTNKSSKCRGKFRIWKNDSGAVVYFMLCSERLKQNPNLQLMIMEVQQKTNQK